MTKQNKKTLLCIIFLIFFHIKALALPALFIDTNGQEKYYYRNFLALAKSVGYTIHFESFFECLNTVKIEPYKTIFFSTSTSIIIHSKNILVEKYVKFVEDLSHQGNKNIILLLSGVNKPAYLHKTMHLLERLGVPLDNSIQPIIKSFLRYLFQPDVLRGKIYGTTLINKIHTSQLQPLLLSENKNVTILPQKNTSFPLGLLVKNKKTGNRYLLTKQSFCCFSELNENFFLTPIHFKQQEKLLFTVQNMLAEFKGVNHKTKLPKVTTKAFITSQKKITEKKLFKTFQKKRSYHWINSNSLSCAWMDLGDFFLEQRKPNKLLPEKEKIKLKNAALKRGLNFIYESEINLLWFEFNPEIFLAQRGIATEKKKKEFHKNINTFAKALKQRFALSKKPIPKIFIGTDITTNFRSAPVAIAAKDFFGRTYSKIPSPLDFKNFWKPELLDVFDIFVDTFKKILPIDGIFLDFEMYHAQKQSADFNNFMDFSDLAWKLYTQKTKQNHLLRYISTERRINNLIATKKLKNYFSVLQKEAEIIGKKIKNHIQKKLPGTLIGAYATSLPGSWFYRGILAGLSSPEEPVIFATFNTNVYSHTQWLNQNNINIIHGAPIMLSKLKTLQDFLLIPELKKMNYFVWYNRPSRMIYPPQQRKNIWWSSEASNLSSEIVAQ
ncbi:hypothetical protein KAH94_00775, partial [bacterium]|nr:hypothetical protein [bacterium]